MDTRHFILIALIGMSLCVFNKKLISSAVPSISPTSCLLHEKRFNLAKAKFEMAKENFKILLMQKKIPSKRIKHHSGKIEIKLSLKHPAVRKFISSSLAMATHEAFLQKCREQNNEDGKAVKDPTSISSGDFFTELPQQKLPKVISE